MWPLCVLLIVVAMPISVLCYGNLDIEIEPLGQEVRAVVGGTADFRCRLRNTQGTVSWHKQAQTPYVRFAEIGCLKRPCALQGPPPVIHTGPDLRLESLQMEDGGHYYCLVWSETQSKVILFHLIIADIPQTYSFEGESAVIPIHVKEGRDVLVWYNKDIRRGREDEGHEVVRLDEDGIHLSKEEFYLDSNLKHLIITKINLAHAGYYTASTGRPWRSLPHSYTRLHVYLLPQDPQLVIPEIIEEGQRTSITCIVSNVKPKNVTFEWTLNREPINGTHHIIDRENGDGSFNVTDEVILSLTREDDNKILQCTTVHGVDKARRALTYETVHVMYNEAFQIRSAPLMIMVPIVIAVTHWGNDHQKPS